MSFYLKRDVHIIIFDPENLKVWHVAKVWKSRDYNELRVKLVYVVRKTRHVLRFGMWLRFGIWLSTRWSTLEYNSFDHRK